jgi:hypothetical protein
MATSKQRKVPIYLKEGERLDHATKFEASWSL